MRPAVEEGGAGVGEGQADQYSGRFEQGLVHEREQSRESVRGQGLPVPGRTRLGREELRRLERLLRLVSRNSGPEPQRGEPLGEAEPLSLGPGPRGAGRHEPKADPPQLLGPLSHGPSELLRGGPLDLQLSGRAAASSALELGLGHRPSAVDDLEGAGRGDPVRLDPQVDLGVRRQGAADEPERDLGREPSDKERGWVSTAPPHPGRTLGLGGRGRRAIRHALDTAAGARRARARSETQSGTSPTPRTRPRNGATAKGGSR